MTQTRALDELTVGETALVHDVLEPDSGDSEYRQIARRLGELGFVPGAALEVISIMKPGGDPIAVRVGATLFALRRREAQLVLTSTQPQAQ
ncbi:MAG: FeoA family protein [Steroidobacteraceae bacterium]